MAASPKSRESKSRIKITYDNFILIYHQVIERRNTAAHETKGDFAHLLLSDPFRGTHPYELWKDLFPILYGASIELVAAQEDADLRDQIGL